MSRPAASAETEDILSSLRRLMAERPAPDAPAEPATEASGPVPETPAPAAEKPEVERLVLTEALRIHPSGADAGEAAAEETEETGKETAGRRLHLGAAPEKTVRAGDDGENSDGTAGQFAGYRDESRTQDATGTDEDAERAEQAQPVHYEEEAANWMAEGDDDSQAEGDGTSARTAKEAEQMTQAWAKAREQDDREPEEILLAEAVEERILDEDTLRELVAQTVREELMGELGERITRNVKKLVRREIQRALTERAFD